MLRRCLLFTLSVAAGIPFAAASAGAVLALATCVKCCRRDTDGSILRPKEPPTPASAPFTGTATANGR